MASTESCSADGGLTSSLRNSWDQTERCVLYNRRENETLIFVCTRVEEIAKSAFDVDGEAIGFHLASEGLVPYQDQEWKVDSESTIHRVQVKAERGLEGARKAERVMRDVRRELYSVCPACHLTVIIG